MANQKPKKPTKLAVVKVEKKSFTAEQLQRINRAEDYVDTLVDYLPVNHPKVLDAKQYVKELEAM